ncbi:MAG: response regulator [Candidatus Korobacteraceae bacterium]
MTAARAGLQVCPERMRMLSRKGSVSRSMKPKRTILCVDDDERSLSIRKVLLETRGYHVLTCTDPPCALEIVRRGGIDLVLADLMMPKLSGAKLIDQIKAISPHTPALLFSGSVNACTEDSLADGWLPKGEFAPMELLERIRILLIRKRGPKRFAVPQQLAS